MRLTTEDMSKRYRDVRVRKPNLGRGNRSTSHQVRRERTLDVADLGALPRGRAIVFASGAPATLIETVPWMNGPHAAQVTASITAHDPILQSSAAETGPAAPTDSGVTTSPRNGRLAEPEDVP